tara:strand:- start:997 stop:1506 length:510 start_codon:yes stop_codon:yes gene_type:complete
MQKLILFLGTLMLLGLLWLWATLPPSESPTPELDVINSEKLAEAPVKLKLAKPKGKMDDPSFMVIKSQATIQNNEVSNNIPPLEARKQLLQQQRESNKTPLNEEIRTELQLKANDKQKQIETLVAELEQNMGDKETRIKLKTKIEVLMQEYNKVILPLALQAMAEKSNS